MNLSKLIQKIAPYAKAVYKLWKSKKAKENG